LPGSCWIAIAYDEPYGSIVATAWTAPRIFRDGASQRGWGDFRSTLDVAEVGLATDSLRTFLTQRRIGYFSMEIALRSEIPTYSGGLGVLAGDTLRSAADLRIPLVAVSLVSRDGYFRQSFDASGRQVEHPDPWHPEAFAEPLPAKVSVTIDGRAVWIGGWLFVVEGLSGGRQPVVLLDTDLPENDPRDRPITHYLYGGDQAYRLSQEIVLGIGGVRMLEALGFRIDAYHLNEGHSALLALQLLRRAEYDDDALRPGESRYDIPAVRAQCHFTTHTPVEAGHDRFDYDLVRRLLGDFIDPATLRSLAGRDELNTTRLALNLSEHVNGVAARHAETARALYPGYRVTAITNGVHPQSWTSAAFAKLYDERVPGWRLEPELLMRAEACLGDEDVWRCHVAAKHALLARVRTQCGVELDPDVPLIGYARRMTQYKRPELFFTDLQRLQSINARQPFQAVFAGKAHPRDASGKAAIENLHGWMRELAPAIKIAYLPDYTMATALDLVSGADIWLNTPQPPLEASGTSGMKAALNGVPNFSVLDGWWVEGHIEGITGWAIGNGAPADGDGDARSLYTKLEHTVLPLFRRREGWVALMKSAISRNAALFHSHRMMRRYAADAYFN
jgi:starch phosphorylase